MNTDYVCQNCSKHYELVWEPNPKDAAQLYCVYCRMLCVRCNLPRRLHVDDQCLYDTASFERMPFNSPHVTHEH